MRKINATEFRRRCFGLMDELGPEGLVITKRGRPVAKLIPMMPGGSELIGCLKGRLRILGRIDPTKAP